MQRHKHDIFMVYLGSLVFVFLLGISIAYTLAAPSGPPETGSGVISANANGNVGIGLSSGAIPAQKLDVVGNVKASGLCIGSDCRSAWPGGAGNIYYEKYAASQATNYISRACPSGKKIIGGGCRAKNISTGADLTCSLQFSNPDEAKNQWECGYIPTRNCGATVYIICQ
jgi:hypothetical protein